MDLSITQELKKNKSFILSVRDYRQQTFNDVISFLTENQIIGAGPAGGALDIDGMIFKKEVCCLPKFDIIIIDPKCIL